MAVTSHAQLLNEDFDANEGGFVSSFTGPATQPWAYNLGTGTWQLFGDEPGGGIEVNDYLTSPAISISSTGGIEIEIEHKYSFEAQWDGGVVQMSIDGGPFTTIPSTSFSAEPYTFPSLIGAHELTGQEAFNGDSLDVGIGSYIISRATSPVGIPAGSSVEIRLTAGFDANTLGTFSPGWEVTNFVVTKQSDGDSDGMPDAYENANGLNVAADDAGDDADSDTISNLDEYLQGTDPQSDDSDNDGLKDNVETGTETYVDQSNTGTDPLNPDTDGDGLLDGAEDPAEAFVDENQSGTNPLIVDSDGDGFDDGLEVLISTSNPTNPASRPLRSGLLDIVAYWDFNDASDPVATYDLVKGFKGDLKAGTVFSADATGRSLTAGDLALDMGAVGGAGTGAIVEQARFLDLAGAQDQIGISFWINTPAPTNSMAFYANSTTVERAFSAHAPWSNGQVYWDTNGCCGAGTQRANVAGGIIVDTWTHIVLNKNGDTKAIWVNGVKLLEKINTDNLSTNFTRFFIGTDSAALNTVGLLDDLAIYADALSDTEIAALAGGDDPLSIVPSNDDSDLDGMPDVYEDANGLNSAVNDAADDLDNDGANNLSEYLNRTDPQIDDTDGDGLKDGAETNTGVWASVTDTGTDPLVVDSDGDGLSDGVENPEDAFVDASTPGTDPNKSDTDEDTYSDSLEISLGSDPTLAGSTPELGVLELLVYYDFNGQTVDQTGNAPDLTLAGSAALTTGGMGLGGIPGDESLDLMAAQDSSAGRVAAGTHFDRINLNDAASVSFWQYNDTPSNSSAFWLIAPNAANGQRGMQAHTPWGNGTVYLDVAGNTTGGVGRLTSTGATIAGQWQHFVFQKSSTGTLEIWIDGVMQSTAEGAPSFVAFDGSFTIGAEGTSLINSFDGRIDEFAVFSDVLDSEQITLLSEGTSPADLFGKQAPLAITDFEYNEATDRATLTWNSKTNAIYSAEVSTDLVNWFEVDDNIPSQGATTTVTLPPGTGAEKYFFRVFRNN